MGKATAASPSMYMAYGLYHDGDISKAFSPAGECYISELTCVMGLISLQNFKYINKKLLILKL